MGARKASVLPVTIRYELDGIMNTHLVWSVLET